VVTAVPIDTVRKTANRLLGSSSKNSYDPDIDIDWDAPVDPSLQFMPYHRVSLYGTPLWDRMSDAQRRELSKLELASFASTGLWFELVLIEMLARWAYHQDPQDPRTQYALAEIGDETRHILMFAKAIARLGAPTYRPSRLVRNLARIYKASARGPALFAPTLVAEEITDRFQRETVQDEQVHPLVRMVNRIHIVEEARHVRFAREELVREMQRAHGPLKGGAVLWFHQVFAALAAAVIAESIISPKVYAAVGLDPKRARRAARQNPNFHETKAWMAEKIIPFLDEVGMLNPVARFVYRRAHLLR
jgi:hypothetical protein